ncbi:ATP-binding protein [Streptomyces sp. NPDC047028]|uniref:ATP-binding protein n=1 Tax=Streptomyces sp. NPDC047028 TaxID=3155793 RepID=UPI0033D6CB5D
MYATPTSLSPAAAPGTRTGGATDPAVPGRDPAPRPPRDDASWPLAHHPSSVGRARRLTAAVLAGWDIPAEQAESALLVLSELVTNAVAHASPPLTVHVHRAHADHRIWVGVTDGGPAPHEGAWHRTCTPEEHGRGLTLIQALTAAHGTHHHPAGVTHWARLTP